MKAHWFAAPLAAAVYPWLLALYHAAAKEVERGAGAGTGAGDAGDRLRRRAAARAPERPQPGRTGGAPTGMPLDPWNIRLLPYYLGAVFFVVAHAFCGLRIVMLAHHAPRAGADRVLAGGIVFAALLATTIILAMCGLRLDFA